MNKSIRKVFALAMCFLLSLTLSVPAFASSSDEFTSTDVAQTAAIYGITEDEVLHLQENLEAAFSQVRGIEHQTPSNQARSQSEPIVIPISENLVLELDGGASLLPTRATDWRVWSTYNIKSIAGITIMTYTANGVFRVSGSTVTPIDAYSSYSSFVWNVTSATNTVGSNYTRSTFDSELNIGIDPISMTIQTFRDNCTLRCTSSGQGSWVWN